MSNAKKMNAPGVVVHQAPRDAYYETMDKLPREIRMLINEAPYPLSCFDFQKMLDCGYSVEMIINFARARLAQIVKVEVAATYGKDHPQA